MLEFRIDVSTGFPPAGQQQQQQLGENNQQTNKRTNERTGWTARRTCIDCGWRDTKATPPTRWARTTATRSALSIATMTRLPWVDISTLSFFYLFSRHLVFLSNQPGSVIYTTIPNDKKTSAIITNGIYNCCSFDLISFCHVALLPLRSGLRRGMVVLQVTHLHLLDNSIYDAIIN